MPEEIGITRIGLSDEKDWLTASLLFIKVPACQVRQRCDRLFSVFPFGLAR